MIDIAGRNEIEILTGSEIETVIGSEIEIGTGKGKETGIEGTMNGHEAVINRRSAMGLHEIAPGMDTEIKTMIDIVVRARRKMKEIENGRRTGTVPETKSVTKGSASAIENATRTGTVKGTKNVTKSGTRTAWRRRGTGTGRSEMGIGIGARGTGGRKSGRVTIGGLTAARERGLELAPERRSRVKNLSLS
jgi:hypothetical protein